MPAPRASTPSTETDAILTVAGMLGAEPAAVERARTLLTLLRDPVRRTMLERLSRAPGRAMSSLADATGASSDDLYHHLRCLTRCRALTRSRHHVYAVDPGALTAIRGYLDTLLTLSARNRTSPAHGH